MTAPGRPYCGPPTEGVCEMARHPPSATAEDMKYRIEHDVRTLVEADEIRKDKKRLGRAFKSAREQVDVLQKVKKA